MQKKLLAFLFIFLFVPIAPANANVALPDDAAFYVEPYAEGRSVEMPYLPAGLPNTTNGRGVLVVNGQVVEQEFEASLGSSKEYCERAGISCSQKKNMDGTYANGHLEFTITNEVTRTYDGRPLGGIGLPVEPGSTVRSTVDKFVLDLDEPNILRFQGKLTHTFVGEDQECAQWAEDDVGGTCVLDHYREVAPTVEVLNVVAFVRAPADGVTVVSKTHGEVDKRLAGEKDFSPLAVGDIVKVGDTVGTVWDADIWLYTGFGSIIVQPLTQLTLDRFELNALKRSGRALLSAGNVGVIIKQPASIRGDFSVATPSGANASIRGSEMEVSYDEATKETTVLVFEDKAYVTASEGQTEIEVPEGTKVTVDADGSVSQAVAMTAEEQASQASSKETTQDQGSEGAGWKLPALAGGILAALALVTILLTRRHRPR